MLECRAHIFVRATVLPGCCCCCLNTTFAIILLQNNIKVVNAIIFNQLKQLGATFLWQHNAKSYDPYFCFDINLENTASNQFHLQSIQNRTKYLSYKSSLYAIWTNLVNNFKFFEVIKINIKAKICSRYSGKIFFCIKVFKVYLLNN